MGKFKKVVSETWADIRGNASYDVIRWAVRVIFYLVLPSLSTWQIYLRGKVVGWFTNEITLYTIFINVLVFMGVAFLVFLVGRFANLVLLPNISKFIFVNNVPVENSVDLTKLEYVPVVITDNFSIGIHFETYAGIRVDGIQSCKGLRARLVSVVSEGVGELSIDWINPTGDDLPWNTKGNPCIIKIVSERGLFAQFIFQNRNYSESVIVVPGTYTLKVEIVEGSNKVTRTEKLNVKIPKHENQYHETGLRWLRNEP